MKKLISLSLVILFSATMVLLSGCNTVAGFGKDIQKGGTSIQKVAKDS